MYNTQHYLITPLPPDPMLHILNAVVDVLLTLNVRTREHLNGLSGHLKRRLTQTIIADIKLLASETDLREILSTFFTSR